MYFEKYEYQIGSHFIAALINGDTSGLDDAEAEALDGFERDTIANHGAGHWSIDNLVSNFVVCEITGLLSECITAKYLVSVE